MSDKPFHRTVGGFVANLVGGLLILTLALVFNINETIVWALGILCTAVGAAGLLTYVYDTKGR